MGRSQVMTIPARPTFYNGIRMRSRLEAGFAAWLDHRAVPWKYEPGAYASPMGQYLPDFELLGGQPTFVEVKPAGGGTPEVYDRMHIIHASVPDARLWVFEGYWDGAGYSFDAAFGPTRIHRPVSPPPVRQDRDDWSWTTIKAEAVSRPAPRNGARAALEILKQRMAAR